jgi:23S rRNA (adenine2503-C2)-methyltransferase
LTTTRYGADLADLQQLVAELGEPSFRARQLHQGLFEQRRPLESLTNIPNALRAQLAARLPLAFEPVAEQRADRDTTVKWLWRAPDHVQVETVLMRYRDRATVCVSSQAGCAMGCTFCATGQAGFDRHLDTGEIVEQVVRAQHASPQRVSNVVFMGMGEPLANTDAVLDACRRLNADLGISARHLTVSTVGVVPGMQRLADFELPVTLAVSLHAPDDALREELVPLNRRYPLAEVVDAAREYAQRKGRRVTFEYACIDEVNDHPQQADALAGRLTGFRGGAHVNLIPLNSTGGYPGRPSPAERIERFAARLREGGVAASIRRNRGQTIDAACGQLRARSAEGPARPAESARMDP